MNQKAIWWGFLSYKMFKVFTATKEFVTFANGKKCFPVSNGKKLTFKIKEIMW